MTSTMSLSACAHMVPNFLAMWCSTRTSIDSVTSAAPRASSSRWLKSSADRLSSLANQPIGRMAPSPRLAPGACSEPYEESEDAMRGAVLYGARDIRFEERDTPKILEPTDAIVRSE